MNVLLQPYKTPHGTTPFNEISLSDYEEAILKGIELHDAEIKQISENMELRKDCLQS